MAALLAAWALAGSSAQAAEDAWEEVWEDDWNENDGLVWTGFAELAAGVRLDGDEPHRATLGELRGRAETQWVRDAFTVAFTGEALHDEVTNESAVKLRELALERSAGGFLDVKAGRQVLTWGTGDLLFLNDLFPKDFESFFAGRDDEYLKAPADAVRLRAYHEWVNVDLVWMPVFEPDVYLDGERFSLFDPTVGRIAVMDPPLDADVPDGLDSGEVALRLFKRVRATEYAFYAYRGYFKQPTARNDRGRPTFAPMNSVGMSLRTPWAGGLVNAEAAWYESRDDGNGDDPRIPNSQGRWLVGYERELAPNFTGALQYYGERIADYRHLRALAPNPDVLPEKWRSLVTARLRYRARRDTVTLGLFVFYSPSDRDYHLRPSVSYRISDTWQVTGGANLFGGRDPHTFFGQLEDNGNVYLRLRRYY